MVRRQRQRTFAMVEDAVDCKDVLDKGGWKSDGVYLIQPPGEDAYRPVRCKMSILGGGWTVIQRRIDGSVNFVQNWEHYKHGFGDVSGEFWYGNEKIHSLTSSSDSEIIFELQSEDSIFYYPFYEQFAVDSEANKYKLHVSGYVHKYGPVMPAYAFANLHADDFLHLDQMKFSTYDQDNDAHNSVACSTEWYGNTAWWFRSCTPSNLNGLFGINSNEGIKWEQITNDASKNTKSLKSTEMMIRRKS